MKISRKNRNIEAKLSVIFFIKNCIRVIFIKNLIYLETILFIVTI